MSKDIKDYLHLYPRCECVYDTDKKQGLTGVITPKIIEWGMYGDNYSSVRNVKPILRPLSDMTEEEKNQVGFGSYQHILRNELGDKNLPARDKSCRWAAMQTIRITNVPVLFTCSTELRQPLLWQCFCWAQFIKL